jgi:REP element-mobilizing transposase RayT
MEANDVPARKRLRLATFDYTDPGYFYFLTIRAADGARLDAASSGLMAAIHEAIITRHRSVFTLWVYCLMPDHLHAGLSPLAGGPSVPRALQAFKSYTTKVGWRFGVTGPLWQRSYYDHIARKSEHVHSIAEYILQNPVRRGLVADPFDWPYSYIEQGL